jgi:hypothetical protein
MKTLLILAPLALLLGASRPTPMAPPRGQDFAALNPAFAEFNALCAKPGGEVFACTRRPPPTPVLELPPSLAVSLKRGEAVSGYARPTHVLCRVVMPETASEGTVAAKTPEGSEPPKDERAVKARKELKGDQAMLQCEQVHIPL